MTASRTIRSRVLAAITLAGVAAPFAAHADDTWTLLTRSYGGTVSVVRGLSQAQCASVRDDLLGRPTSAQLALTDDVMKRWSEWTKSHGCRTSVGSAIFAESHTLSDGTCIRGREFITPGEGVGHIDSGTIAKAMCFQ